MIISKQKDQLVLVRQDDHGIHAGEIVKHWGNNHFVKPTPNDSICFSIDNHDISWKEADDAVLFNSEMNRPRHFTEIDLLDHLKFYNESYQYIVDKDPYAGILMGMHWNGLYTRRYGYKPDFVFKRYNEVELAVIEQEKAWVELKQKLWNVEQPRVDFENQIWMHYELFQFIDQFSLFICMADHDEKVERTIGPVRSSLHAPRIDLTVRTLGDGRVQVSPFPFDGEFEVAVSAHKIPDRKYESHADAYDVVQQTKQEEIRCRICP